MAAKKKASSGEKPFHAVWKILLKVPRGRVVTYGQSEGVTFDREGRIDLDRFGWRPRTR